MFRNNKQCAAACTGIGELALPGVCVVCAVCVCVVHGTFIQWTVFCPNLMSGVSALAARHGADVVRVLLQHDRSILLEQIFHVSQNHMVVVHLFGVEFKGSEQQAVHSGVFLAIARPTSPPETTHRELVPETACWPLSGVWLAFLPFCFWAVLPSVPTHALLCR